MKLVFILLLLPLTLFAQYQPNSGNQIIEHEYYTLNYNEQHEQADWVYYRLDADLINGGSARKDNFRPDPSVTTASATLSDYKASGYDRGHLAPAGDMKTSVAMSESFYMSNMSPQAPSFNRGGWKNLEAMFRQWGYEHEIYVVTGPIFKDNKGDIGDNHVTIPGYYYKIAYCPVEEQMIAFVMPNEKLTKPIESYVVPTDYVEQMTGIDFFSQLEDGLEDKLEASVIASDFEFKTYQSKGKTATTTAVATSQQCKGITKTTGLRCKKKTSSATGFCHHHEG